MKNQVFSTPSLYIKQWGEQISKPELSLTSAARKVVVRFTGGCGWMSKEDAVGFYDIFVEAFAGFEGAILFGGSRMLKKDDPTEIVPGITEIPPLIKKNCPKSVILGVVPRFQDLKLSQHGLVISDELGNDFITIVNPDQGQCVVVQKSADEGVSLIPNLPLGGWEIEYLECQRIISDLINYADFSSLLVSYNGGKVTEAEIVSTAQKGWPILLINGSGRKSEEYANNQKFLEEYPNVFVAEKDAASIRDVLLEAHVLKPEFKVLDYRKVVNA